MTRLEQIEKQMQEYSEDIEKLKEVRNLYCEIKNLTGVHHLEMMTTIEEQDKALKRGWTKLNELYKKEGGRAFA